LGVKEQYLADWNFENDVFNAWIRISPWCDAGPLNFCLKHARFQITSEIVNQWTQLGNKYNAKRDSTRMIPCRY
jgi:hypothetical protein